MKNMNLEKHIDAAMDAYQQAFSKLDKWRNKKSKAAEKVHEQEEKMTKDAAFTIHAEFVKEYEEKLRTIQSELNEEVDKTEKAYMNEIADFYQPNGEAINQADKALLDSGILKKEELRAMIQKHGENPTMLRIIGKDVKAHNIELDFSSVTALKRAENAGQKEADIFKSFRQLCRTVIGMGGSDSVSRELFLKSAVNAEEYAEDAKIEILKASLYLDDEKKAKLEAMEEAKKRKNENWVDL